MYVIEMDSGGMTYISSFKINSGIRIIFITPETEMI
jgi:hypothetical protein